MEAAASLIASLLFLLNPLPMDFRGPIFMLRAIGDGVNGFICRPSDRRDPGVTVKPLATEQNNMTLAIQRAFALMLPIILAKSDGWDQRVRL
jgi:hypothetical protein